MSTAINVLYCAPIPRKGSYIGGIASILNAYKAHSQQFKTNGVNIDFQAINVDYRGHETGKHPRIGLLKSFFAGRVFCKHGFDNNNTTIIHINTSRGITLLKDLLICKYIKRHSDSKVVLSLHYAEIDEILSLRIPVKCWKKLFSYADETIFLSEKTRQQFLDRRIVCQENSSLLYTFHDTHAPTTVKKEAPDGLKHVLFLGSLDKRKGVLDLLEAFEMLPDKSVALEICGTGEPSILQRIEEVSAVSSKVVNYHGYVSGDEKSNLLLMSSVFCLPSYGEGLPLALLEAMAYGCVPVVGNVGAIVEVIEHGHNGLLVEPGNIDMIATNLEVALRDFGTISENARATSAAFSIEENIVALSNIYKRVSQ